MCKACETMMIQFRRKCSDRAKSIQKEYVPGRSVEITASSPSLVEKYVSYENKYKNKLKCTKYYYQKNYCAMMSRTGVDVTADQAALLFNKDTEKAYQTIIDQEVDSIDQKKLIGYLCKQSWENTRGEHRGVARKRSATVPLLLNLQHL